MISPRQAGFYLALAGSSLTPLCARADQKWAAFQHNAVRLAELSQEDHNRPAATPPEHPRGLVLPVKPDNSPQPVPAAPPAAPAAPPAAPATTPAAPATTPATPSAPATPATPATPGTPATPDAGAPATGAPAAPATPMTPDAGAPVTPDAGAPATPDAGAPATTPTDAGATDDTAQYEGREISDVRVVGNRVVPAESILAQVRTQKGAAYSPRQAQLDRGRVDELGYFASTQAQVSPDVEDPNKVVVTFIVVENRVLTGFRFENNSSVSAADLLKVLTSKKGAVLNRQSVNTDVAAVQKAYSDHGLAVLVLSAQQDQDGVLVFVLQEARISKILLSGLRKTRESVIRRQLRAKVGDSFNATLLRKDLNRIYDLGFFDDVNFKVDDDPNQPGAVIVTILLKEHRTGSLSFGIGFDSRSKLSVFTTISENNLGGSGKHAMATVETGSIQDYEFGYGDPFIGKKNSSYDISIYDRLIYRDPQVVQTLLGGGTTVNNTVTYEERRVGGRISYAQPLDIDGINTLEYGYRNERAKLFQQDSSGNQTPVTGANGLPLDSSGTVSAFSLGFLHDGRDIRLDPSSGSREQVTIEKAFSLLGGTTQFTKLDLDLRHYIPLERAKKLGDLPKLVLAGRFVLGKALNQLPAFEQYFVGGSDTIRGYDTDIQFGDNQVYGNLELRYRLQRKFTLVGFFDSGSAYGGNFSSQRSISLLSSIGAGIRLTTPIGPIRLDVGRGSRGIRTHFAIGTTF